MCKLRSCYQKAILSTGLAQVSKVHFWPARAHQHRLGDLAEARVFSAFMLNWGKTLSF